MAVQGDVLEVLLRVIGLRSFQSEMGAATASVREFGASQVKSDAALAASGRKVESRMALLRKVGVGTAAALAVTAAEGIKMSINFQKELTLVHTQAGAPLSDMKMLHDRILDLAHVLPQGPEELARGLYHMESVFNNSKTALAGLEIAAKGAATGNANLEDTTTALAAATRALFRDVQPSVGQLSHTMGVLNAIIGAGNMRMDDLSLALGTAVVPAGIAAGLTIEDMGGALATLTDEGQRADNAATHLRMAFTLMGASSKIARKNLATIGISATELGVKLHGPNGLVEGLRLVKERLEAKFPTFGKQLSEVRNPNDALALAQRFNVISRAFGGARSSATIMLLLNNLDLLQSKTTRVYLRSGTLAENFADTQKTSAYQIHTAWSGLQADLIRLGEILQGPATSGFVGLLHALGWVVRALKNMLTAGDDIKKFYDNLPGSVQIAAQGLGIFTAVVGGAIAATVGWTIALGVLDTLLGITTGLVETLYVAVGVFILENPFVLLAAAVVAAVILIILHWKQVKQAFIDVWDWIKSHWRLLAMILGGPFIAAGIFIATHWQGVKRTFHEILYGIGHIASTVAKFIKDQFVSAWHFITGLPHKLTSLPGKFLNAINPMHLIPHHASGIVGSPGGWAQINETASGESVYLPRGASVQPSPATSMREPRAHTPNPTPIRGGEVHEHYFTFMIDGKEMTGVVLKEIEDKRARR